MSQETSPRVVAGVDPGLASTGYAVLEFTDGKPKLLEGGIVRTSADDALEGRLRAIHDALSEVFSEFRPGTVVVEDLYTDYRVVKTAVLMGHARGAVLLAASANGARVVSYAPSRVKKAMTGNGLATKEQMQRMIQAALGLKEVPRPDHVADAIALALCHADMSRRI